MKLQLATLLIAVVSMSVFPAGTRAASNVTAATDLVQSSKLEPPHALPLAVASAVPAAPAAAALNNDLGEIWQEDDHEVLIRNARRAKDNNGGGAAAGGSVGGGGTGAGSSAGKKGKGVKKAQRQSGAKATVTPAAAAAAAPSRGDGAVEKSGADGTKIPPNCRYTKSAWSDCDLKTNTRSRTLSLKRGEDCVPTRTIQKKCKKACRYEKGVWTECTSGQMSRSDRLKTASDPTCQQTRDVTKNCNQGKSKADKKDRPAKNGKQDKGQRKGGRA